MRVETEMRWEGLFSQVLHVLRATPRYPPLEMALSPSTSTRAANVVVVVPCFPSHLVHLLN